MGYTHAKGLPENNVVNLVPCLPVNRREKWIRCSLISPKQVSTSLAWPIWA